MSGENVAVGVTFQLMFTAFARGKKYTDRDHTTTILATSAKIEMNRNVSGFRAEPRHQEATMFNIRVDDQIDSSENESLLSVLYYCTI